MNSQIKMEQNLQYANNNQNQEKETSQVSADDNIMNEIFEKIKSEEDGILDQILYQTLSYPKKKIDELLNKLLGKKQIKGMEGSKPGTCIYHYQDLNEQSKLKKLSQEEVLIYKIIASEKSNGILQTDIKKKSQITQQKQVNKILKILENGQLIKAIKPAHLKNKILWFKFDVVPSDDMTPSMLDIGSNAEKVQALYDRILQYITVQQTATQQQITISLRSAFSSFQSQDSDLKDPDVHRIIKALVYDDKIEEIQDPLISQNKLNPVYKLTKWDKSVKEPFFNQTPCGNCPVINECMPGNIISPERCIYYNDW